MKKFILSLIVLMSGLFLSAQEHMSFKGIPITGNITKFVSSMSDNGFTVLKEVPGVVVMTGSFAGLDNCTVYVLYTAESKTVWKVAVSLPEKSSWFSIKSQYDDFQTRFIAKYGKPDSSYSFFLSPYKEDDGYELQALRVDKAFFASFWKSNKGDMSLQIYSDEVGEAYLSISYEDAAGGKIKDREKDKQVSKDI